MATGSVLARPAALRLALLAIAVAAVAGATAAQSAVTVSRVITLDDALRFTRENHHSLRAATLTAEAARSRAREAGRRPDPTLAAGYDNFGGSLGTDRAEASLRLEQTFELGGDRAARAGMADAVAALSRLDRARLAGALEGLTVERFCAAWVLQERARHLREAEHNAEVALEGAEARLKAGAAPAFERLRARSQRSLRAIERRNAETELEAAHRALALQWGNTSAAFDSLVLADPASVTPPALETLVGRLESHPERQRAAAENAAEMWRVREARSRRTPDLQLGAGVRHLSEVDGTGLVAGVSLPLPLWNSRRESVAAAEAEWSAAQARENQIALELSTALESAHRRLVTALDAWREVRDQVRPAALEALEQIQGGYRSGRLAYLEVHEGQRSVLEADLLLTEAAADVWRSWKELERLAGSATDAAPAKEER